MLSVTYEPFSMDNNLGTHILLIKLTNQGLSYRLSRGEVMILRIDTGVVPSAVRHMRRRSTCVCLYPACHRYATLTTDSTTRSCQMTPFGLWNLNDWAVSSSDAANRALVEEPHERIERWDCFNSWDAILYQRSFFSPILNKSTIHSSGPEYLSFFKFVI